LNEARDVRAGSRWRRIGRRAAIALVALATVAGLGREFAVPYFPQSCRSADGTVLRYEQVSFGIRHECRRGPPQWLTSAISRLPFGISMPWWVSSGTTVLTPETGLVWLSWNPTVRAPISASTPAPLVLPTTAPVYSTVGYVRLRRNIVSDGFSRGTRTFPGPLVAREGRDPSPPTILPDFSKFGSPFEKWRCVVVEDSGVEVSCHWAGGMGTRGPNGYAREHVMYSIPKPQKPCRVIRLRVYENDGRLAGEFRVPNPWPHESR
jgi:hypothetical protein